MIAAAERPVSLRRLRVLVVEDSWNVANTIKGILESADASVLGPVPSVAEALALIRTQPVSLALVDMNLRESFADEVINELVAREIPYAIVTAYVTLPSDADSRAVAVLHKPVDADQLLAVAGRFVAG